MRELIREILDILKDQIIQLRKEVVYLLRSKKNLINLLILGILVLALPLGVDLLRKQQILKSRANVEPIVFAGPNVEQRDSKWIAFKPQVNLQITSPLGPPAPPPTPTPVPAATPDPNAKIIGYEAFTIKKTNGEQKVVQSLLSDDRYAYGRNCSVTGTGVVCPNTPGSWTWMSLNPPEGSSPIISYGAFAYYSGTQQKVTQSLLADNGTTFARTCNVGADDVNWVECNTFGWTPGTIAAPDGSGAKIIGYEGFTLVWFDATGVVTKQKIVQSLVANDGRSFGRTCNVTAQGVNWPECNTFGWTQVALNAPDGSGVKIISYGAFSYYEANNFGAGSKQKVTQSLVADNGTTFARTCNVGADDVNWVECNTFGWTKGTISPPRN